MNYFVYIVECADGTYYTGITNNLEKRVRAHNSAATAAKYTKVRRPVRLVYSEVSGNRGAALVREAAIKRLRRAAKEALIESAA